MEQPNHEKVQREHRARNAYLYIRQSTLRKVAVRGVAKRYLQTAAKHAPRAGRQVHLPLQQTNKVGLEVQFDAAFMNTDSSIRCIP